MSVVSESQTFIQEIEKAFASSNKDFARAYYLFATAKLLETYNSQEIYERYPVLSDEKSFHQLKALFDKSPQDEDIKRLFSSVLGTYIGKQLAELSDTFQNLKNQLKIDVSALNLNEGETEGSSRSGQTIKELLYEDVSQWLKKLPDKSQRQKLYDLMADAYTQHLTPKYIELFEKENKMLADLGYPDVIAFYSQMSGHNLKKLGKTAKKLVTETQDLYTERMGKLYQTRTGLDFSQATRADISYVIHGGMKAMASINERFPEENMVPLAIKTFDGLGLSFSSLAQPVNLADLNEFEVEVVDKTEHHTGTLRRILLDISKREGKRSRAYVYPAQVPSEIYLSVKPEGGLDDYSAFFHESGHAQHFAYESPDLSFAQALMGNNTVTEAYAYLFQNLFLNRHWLEHMAGLPKADALKVVQNGALNDLYMLRRYASKMQFELILFDGVNTPGYQIQSKGEPYAKLLTQGCGYAYDAEGWSRDVDAGFYVADYFTAWTLEAQLRTYLTQQYGDAACEGENWYENPKAGAFLKNLWKDGNINQSDLSTRLGYGDPNDVEPLVCLMRRNLG